MRFASVASLSRIHDSTVKSRLTANGTPLSFSGNLFARCQVGAIDPNRRPQRSFPVSLHLMLWLTLSQLQALGGSGEPPLPELQSLGRPDSPRFLFQSSQHGVTTCVEADELRY